MFIRVKKKRIFSLKRRCKKIRNGREFSLESFVFSSVILYVRDIRLFYHFNIRKFISHANSFIMFTVLALRKVT